MTKLHHFKLLVWKNWKIARRKPCGLCCTLLGPILIVGLLAVLRNLDSLADSFLQTEEPRAYCPITVSGADFERLGRINLDGTSCEDWEFSHNAYPYSWLNNDGDDYRNVIFVPDTDQVKTLMSLVITQFAAARFPECPTNSTFRTKWSTNDDDASDLENMCFAANAYTNSNDDEVSCTCLYFTTMATQDDALQKAANGGVAVVVAFDQEDPLPASKDVKYDLRFAANLPNEADGPEDDRWRTRQSWPDSLIGPMDSFEVPYTGGSGFLFTQNAVNLAIAGFYHPQQELPNSIPRLNPMPWPAYEEDFFLNLITGVLPFLLVFFFIYPAQNVARELIIEKEERLREAMRMMGLSDFLNYSAWFFKHWLVLTIMSVIVTILFSASDLLVYSQPFAVFLLFEFTVVATVSYGFLMSMFFRSANVGGASAAIVWVVMFVPYLVIQDTYAQQDSNTKAGLSLFPPTALNMGFAIIRILEDQGTGVTMENMSKDPVEGDDFSFSDVLGMLLLSSVIMLALAWYFDNVLPKQYGSSRSPFFFTSYSYWCGAGADADVAGNNVIPMEQLQSGADQSSFEPSPPGAEAGIAIKNLWKVWSTPTGPLIAVEDLNLNVHKGEITALLGHNGAGKTTTMSIIVGMYTASNGAVSINGHDVHGDPERARASLGLCPQFDILFRELTVREHLYFFLRMKGVTDKKYIRDQIDIFLKDVGLDKKGDTRSKNLSGGQKRALSVAIAFIGEPETVILDEPTSGMDPQKRRETWDLIIKHKQNKTIMLTTHFMDEADLLGDRVAIMASGKMSCVGTPLFLKSRYGVGYHVTIAKGDNFHSDDTKRNIEKAVPEAILNTDIGSELSYVIPTSASGKFPELFRSLELNKQDLGIESIGCSCSTLEEVFLKVGDLEHEKRAEEDGDDNDALLAAKNNEYLDSTPKERNTGMKLWFQKLHALITKRRIHSFRYFSTLISQALIPALMVFTALAIEKFAIPDQVQPAVCRNLFSRESAFVAAADSTFGGSGFSVNGENIADDAKLYFESVGTRATLRDESTNMTQWILNQTGDYLQDQFFQDQVASLSITGGLVALRYNRNEGRCEVSTSADVYDETAWVEMPSAMTLHPDATYVFKYPDRSENIAAPSITLSGPEESTGSFETSILEEDNDNGGCQDCHKGYLIRPTSDSSPAQPVSLVCGNLDNAEDPTSNATLSIGSTAPFNNGEAVYAWFSLIGIHAAPISLQAVGNTIMRHHLSDEDVSIAARNCPLPKTVDEIVEDTSFPSSFSLMWWFSIALAFLAASFLFFPVNEKSSHSKHVQFISGADEYIYWLSTFLWDCIALVVPFALMVIIVAAFNMEDFKDDRLGMVALLLALGMPAMLPLQYQFSFIFESSSVAYSMSILFFLLFNTASLIAVAVLRIPSFPDSTKDIGTTLHRIFLLNPQYAISSGVGAIMDNYFYLDLCSQQDGECTIDAELYNEDYFSTSRAGIGLNILFLVIDLVLWFVVLFLIEFFHRRQLFGFGTGKRDAQEDQDVAQERMRIEQNQGQVTDQLVVNQLSKRFGNFTAVNNMSFGVPAGQCFGLLGVNGAGKTTTFRMLTGEIGMSGGAVSVDGLNLKSNLRTIRQRIGYCPQYDGLIPSLTGRELLVMFARLRGVPEEHIENIVNEAIQQMDLTKHCDRLAGTYSGGNKRKLATCLALIGNPSIVFLDEPTSGMDPGARRFLWNVLSAVTRSGKSIILTSHSMEECEALCHRLTIMKAGRMSCLGTLQRLKSRFGKGYTVIVKQEPGAPEASQLKELIVRQLKGHLQSEHNGEITFRIPESFKLSDIFATIEMHRDGLKLIDYGVSQTSLEQIFLNIASGNDQPMQPHTV